MCDSDICILTFLQLGSQGAMSFPSISVLSTVINNNSKFCCSPSR